MELKMSLLLLHTTAHCRQIIVGQIEFLSNYYLTTTNLLISNLKFLKM